MFKTSNKVEKRKSSMALYCIMEKIANDKTPGGSQRRERSLRSWQVLNINQCNDDIFHCKQLSRFHLKIMDF